MHWIFLICAIGFEVTATTFLKMSHGWTKLIPTVMALIFFPTSTLVYALALKKIEVSLAYAMWSGLGTAAMAVVGWLIFKEHISLMRGIFIGVIIFGIAGLNLSR